MNAFDLIFRELICWSVARVGGQSDWLLQQIETIANKFCWHKVIEAAYFFNHENGFK